MWLALARRGKEPSTIVKFSFGLVLVGASFFLFVAPLAIADGGHKAAALWLVAIYFVQTCGELMLSPVGLSVTTKTAPVKYASQMMGVWFLAVTAGDATTGLLSIAGVDLNKTGIVAARPPWPSSPVSRSRMYRKRVEGTHGRRPLIPADLAVLARGGSSHPGGCGWPSGCFGGGCGGSVVGRGARVCGRAVRRGGAGCG